MSDFESDKLLNGSLNRLSLLRGLFEEDSSSSLLMATEIWNVLEGTPGKRISRSKKFPAPRNPVDQIPIFPIVTLIFGIEPPTIGFLPILCDVPEGVKYEMLGFEQWWTKELAYQPLRAPDDSAVVNVRDLTRFGIIKMVRNKMSAHHDIYRPRILDELNKSLLIESWSFEMNGRKFSLGDPALNVTTPYLYALLRQIAHEVLIAFGKENLEK